MSARYVSSVEVLEHGNTFVPEELRGFIFRCPECKEKLSPENVEEAKPDTRHTMGTKRNNVFFGEWQFTVFCPNCSCVFRATVKEK